MARNMKQGDTWEPLRGSAMDESGTPVNLSTAASLEMIAVGPTHTIQGPATAIWPTIADDDGIHHWNWQYNFAAGDTAIVGTYKVYLRVTWVTGEIETYPDDGSETLVIEAL